MTKFIKEIFKTAGVNAKVSKDTENPRFRVTENKLTLEGKIRSNRYSMTIKDNTGKVIDNLSVYVNNSNDIVNRINESINTLKMLSPVYDNQKLVEEDEEFDNVSVDEEAPQSLEDGLMDLYDNILDVAAQAEALSDLADESDAEQLSTLTSFTSSLYDCAIDVDDYVSEITDVDDEDVNESLKRTKTSKGFGRKAINNITMAESLLRGCPELRDITKALKDIKSELIVRGF